MLTIHPVTLEGYGIRLEPLAYTHQEGLAVAAADGKLWEPWFTVVPDREQVQAYIADALAGQEADICCRGRYGTESGTIVGSTRFHDIVAEIDRVEIGATWYGKRWQRSHVNTSCKLLLLCHAFATLG